MTIKTDAKTIIGQMPAIATEIDGQRTLIQVVKQLGHDPALCTSAQLQEIADRLSEVAGGGFQSTPPVWGATADIAIKQRPG